MRIKLLRDDASLHDILEHTNARMRLSAVLRKEQDQQNARYLWNSLVFYQVQHHHCGWWGRPLVGSHVIM